MSMSARFVAITAEQLAAVTARPALVGSVFALDAERPFDSPEMARARLRRQAPQLVAEMLDRLPPPVGQRLRRRLGLGSKGIPGLGYNSPLIMQLAEREAARRRRPPTPGSPGHSISLDKAWHGLHYLLCGAVAPTPGPFGQAVFGGGEVSEDNGYGPARCFTAAQVSEIADALTVRGVEPALKTRFDADAMTRLGVYPGVWDNDDRTWLIDAFRKLRAFYAAASGARQAVATRIE
jgi:Domain of unknown function (DUF1877)